MLLGEGAARVPWTSAMDFRKDKAKTPKNIKEFFFEDVDLVEVQKRLFRSCQATQLRMLNFVEEEDYFDDLWDEARSLEEFA